MDLIRSYEDEGEIESIACKVFEENPFQRIIAINERDILRAAQLRQRFGLKGQSYQSALAFCDKIVMKEALAKKGISVPNFRKVQSLNDIVEFIKDFGFPAILKPSRGTECQGVQVFKDDADLKAFLQKGELPNQSKDSFLEIESFIDGQMYHVNGLQIDGKIIYSWPSLYLQQPIKLLLGQDASSYLLSEENPLVPKLNDYAKEILAALPTPPQAAFHLEVFLTPEGELVFCEIASRVGGKGVNLGWIESFEIDLKAAFIRSQVDIKTSPPKRFPFPKTISGEVWFPQVKGRLQSIEKACPFSWVKNYEVNFQAGDHLSHPKAIGKPLAGTSLIVAPSEKIMRERIQELRNWFIKSTKFY